MGNSSNFSRKNLTNKYHNLERRETINLSYKNIRGLDQNIFYNLIKLKSINLSHNVLELLNPLFYGLINLIEIDLQYNQLKELDSKSFVGLYNLKIIRLQDNQLKAIHSELFQDLVNLERIYLNNNQINQLSPNLFKDCSNLEYVRLQNNELKDIDPYIFKGLKRLKVISLYNNNWTSNWLELVIESSVTQVSFKNHKENEISDIVDPAVGIYNGKYKRITQIGKGASCNVHTVKNIFDNNLYALKALSDLNTYSRELELMKLLRSPYILKYHDSFMHRGLNCIVTEICHGGDLRERIKKAKDSNTKFDEATLQLWSREIIMALAYIHEKNIIHRDIKPANIFLTENGHIKLGDFGVSTINDEDDDDNLTVVGTTAYMSPEIRAEQQYTQKTDLKLRSTGCVIYEMITLECFRDDLINNLNDLNTNIKLKLLLKKMLVINPDERASSLKLKNLLI